jgi:hypothetical protein
MDFELSYGVFDPMIQSLMFSSWSSDVIKNGAGVGESMTLERRIALPSGSYDYMRFVGCVVNQMSLDISAGEIITGRFDMMGKWGGRATSIITGATYTDSDDVAVMSAASQFGSLSMDGITGTPKIRSISIQMTNNIRQQDALGSVDAIGLAPGRFEATGSMEVYFENGNMFDAFLNHDDVALEFTLGSVTAEKYTFLFPTIKLERNMASRTLRTSICKFVKTGSSFMIPSKKALVNQNTRASIWKKKGSSILSEESITVTNTRLLVTLIWYRPWTI